MEKQIKKRKCNQKEEQDHQKHGIDNLPYEITLDILSRLPITSLIQFGFVCRSWHTLAHDHHLANLHLHRAGKNNPYLIFHCDYPIRNQLHFAEFLGPDYEGIVRQIDTPFSTSMPEFNVIGSCNGLLCLSDSLFNDAIYIYNPFTRNYKELPESTRFQEQQMLIGFGFHPATNEYKVVKILYYRNPSNEPWRRRRRFIHRDNTQSEVQIYSLRDKAWRSIGPATYQLERRSSEAVLVSGRLHWVSRPGRYNGVRGRTIISFDLAEERFYEVKRPDFGELRRYNYHLAVLGGFLSAAVCCGNGKLEIWVMKEYGNTDSWIKEFDVGAYSSKFLSQDLQRCYGIWRNVLSGRVVRVLGLMKNGEILLEYKGGSLALYNPEGSKFRDLVFKGTTPKLFQTIVHFGSLNWIDNPLEM